LLEFREASLPFGRCSGDFTLEPGHGSGMICSDPRGKREIQRRNFTQLTTGEFAGSFGEHSLPLKVQEGALARR